jgi:hypothetical protein
MGNRYTMTLPCAKCGEMNIDIWYAPSSGFDNFKCKSCGTVNDIILRFMSKIHGDNKMKDPTDG